jgi:hypothetical protein
VVSPSCFDMSMKSAMSWWVIGVLLWGQLCRGESLVFWCEHEVSYVVVSHWFFVVRSTMSWWVIGVLLWGQPCRGELLVFCREHEVNYVEVSVTDDLSCACVFWKHCMGRMMFDCFVEWLERAARSFGLWKWCVCRWLKRLFPLVVSELQKLSFWGWELYIISLAMNLWEKGGWKMVPSLRENLWTIEWLENRSSCVFIMLVLSFL